MEVAAWLTPEVTGTALLVAACCLALYCLQAALEEAAAYSLLSREGGRAAQRDALRQRREQVATGLAFLRILWLAGVVAPLSLLGLAFLSLPGAIGFLVGAGIVLTIGGVFAQEAGRRLGQSETRWEWLATALWAVAALSARVLQPLAGIALRPWGRRASEKQVSEGEAVLSELAEPTAESLLSKVARFGGRVVSEVMTPRTQIVSLSADATMGDALRAAAEHGYSRYPVAEESMDNVIGIVHLKDFIQALIHGEGALNDPVRKQMRPAHFIPENKRLGELLTEMQRQKLRMAIVIDEYGGTAGLVTLADLVEEIVGSIEDEFEREEKEVEIIDEKTSVVMGQTEIEEANALLGTELQTTEFQTIGGWVFGQFGRIPRPGEQLRYRNFRFEVLEMDGRRIEKIKVTKL